MADKQTGRKCREVVCRDFCSFFKPGGESMECGTLAFLRANLTTGEIVDAAARAPREANFSKDPEIKALVCAECAFLLGGCDFRTGSDSPPCGGYTIVETLLKRP